MDSALLNHARHTTNPPACLTGAPLPLPITAPSPQVVFLPNYNVSEAEVIIPAAEVRCVALLSYF
jgi:glucan phosphorylase